MRLARQGVRLPRVAPPPVSQRSLGQTLQRVPFLPVTLRALRLGRRGGEALPELVVDVALGGHGVRRTGRHQGDQENGKQAIFNDSSFEIGLSMRQLRSEQSSRLRQFHRRTWERPMRRRCAAKPCRLCSHAKTPTRRRSRHQPELFSSNHRSLHRCAGRRCRSIVSPERW